MKRKYAIGIFICVCLLLTILLLTNIITSIVSGVIFAVALMVFGSLSRGFRGKDESAN
jgi:hypothetical protein